MFSKIDKKVLSVAIIIIILAVLTIFAGYKYLSAPQNGVENKTGGAEIQSTDDTSGEVISDGNQNQIDISDPEIEFNSNTQVDGGAMLTVCKDECGNSVCQPANPECSTDPSKCICAEDVQSCPEDCK